MDNLIVVYNADSGKWNAYLDMAHKIFSPSTYACKLCAITHGIFKVEKEWAAFVESIDTEITFLHRDEWLQHYDQDAELPAIFRERDGTISVLISAREMATMDLRELQQSIEERL